MKLTLEEVDHIALLARLALTDDEKARYQKQLSAILDHVAALQQLDTSHVAPTSSVLPPRSMLRMDEPLPGLTLEDALRNAPDCKDDQFRVPPVLD